MKDETYTYQLYVFYNLPIVVLVRFTAAVVFLLFIVFVPGPLRLPVVSLLMTFFINEIFVYFKINRLRPSVTIDKANGDFEMAMLPSARAVFEDTTSPYEIVKRFEHLPSVQFVANKVGVTKALTRVEVAGDDLLVKAQALAHACRGLYICEADLYGAYIILSESTAKILETNELSEDDVVHILYWARDKFSVESLPAFHPVFSGLGFGEFLVYGWNYEVQKYADDFSSTVLSRPNAPTMVGRATEYESLITALSKKKQNNVLLIGEPGVGSTTIVEYFTYNSHVGSTPPEVARRKVYQIHVDRILSGVQNQGELAERLDLLLTDVAHSGNVILFIPNIENIFGGGGFAFDVSGVLFDYIKDATLQIIGITSPGGFKKYIQKQGSILENFEAIRVEEPDKKEALYMVLPKIEEIEEKYRVSFVYKAILSSVELSSSYLLDSYLPGKALTLLESVASETGVHGKRLIQEADILKKIEEKTHIILGHPDEKERTMLLHLEDTIHKRVVDQQEAVFAVANALRRLRSGFKNSMRPISVFLFLGPTGVGKTETAKVLASLYFQSEKQMLRLDMSEFQTPESVKRLLGSLPGEDELSSKFLDELLEHPFSLVLLDEFEKANPKILDIFLQVFDDGRLTDNLGRRVSFSNTIIIATSNAGSEMIRERLQAGKKVTDIKAELLEYLQRERIFKPELLNRFDDIVVFKPLTPADVEQIAQILLAGMLEQLTEQQITLTADKSVIEKITAEAFNAEFGARPVRRYLEQNIESVLSTMILKGELKKGDHKRLSVDSSGSFVVV